MSEQLFAVDSTRLWYVLVFGVSALVCFVGLRRTAYIEHDETRRGLYWLLLTSGVWATIHVGYLTASTPRLQYALFVGGLVVGLAAIGPWLYFCSAYTGRLLHRDETIRRLAVALFVLIVTVKLTNPIHGRYFSTEPATIPFAHLQIHHEPLHWIVMGLAYALSFVGFFMLFELFVRVNSDTRPLFVLVGLTGLPVVLDLLGGTSTILLDITYSSIGVAAFSTGVLFVYLERFQLVRTTGDADDPVIVLDDRDRLRDYNQRAAALFPSLTDGVGRPLEALVPPVESALDSSDPLLEIDVDASTRYYSVSSNPFSLDRARLGRTITLTDVTRRERYRRTLEHQNDRLERFASIVSHDLRNPLTVARGRTVLAIEEDDTDHLEPVVEAHERMETLIDDLLTLAREGTSIDEVERVDPVMIARQSWEMIESEGATLVIEGDSERPLEADSDRLQQLFENLFRNAIEHGGRDVTITVGSLSDAPGFYLEDDGPGIPPDEHQAVLDPGYTTTSDGTGFGLSIVTDIVDGHGWQLRLSEGEAGGARFDVLTDEPIRDS
ncbi:histidine kinase [Natrarchaeobius halalkaliphilus]|uniref:histidine kinase n=1 Tax=Natrarchaeobius halalkaliphilus TaxID=1679091 RepID=A0A3N6MCN2_9EURY|nr:ATP-binding protein [Natrarchaeobius halalkaliphilus]RQG93261.1 histidine kinase [Natrarchaeobius halalkaliphilus]